MFEEICMFTTADDFVGAQPFTVDLLLGRFTGPPPLYSYVIALDGLDEPVECLVITLSINETALDPRDQGLVDLANSVALVRIEDGPGIQ